MKKVALIFSFLLIAVVSVFAYYELVDTEDEKETKKTSIVEKDPEEVDYTYAYTPPPVVEEPVEEVVEPVIDESIVNEDGKIMIVMYHKFTTKSSTSDEWTRSLDDFKKDLTRLYENNYRPISMTDYLTNNIDVPYGMTPVVLTFDDGDAGQLAFDYVDGELVARENTAVKIMQDFNKEHPDFELRGTFYITATNFFGGKGTFGDRLKYITDLGFEIGNLTKTHYALGNAKSASKVQEEVGGLVKFVREYLPDYTINSLSLPGGSRAKSLENYMYEGEYQGVKYKNLGVVSIFNSRPALSPTDSELNVHNIPRIKANDGKEGINYWLLYFEEHPEEKYVSDGKI
ncbi:MAG: polysaccharide deacetylase family protein [Clostridia bacterium]|nr:polysaccharide deacetylase family protein [Clostridia bacterium]